MFSLRDLRFVLCSRDLDVLRAQRIIGFFIFYPQINDVRKGHLFLELCLTSKGRHRFVINKVQADNTNFCLNRLIST